ncbi:hypothetical protein [Vagococcus fluvialis]|uniref:hypothetical protein n=1 Tax=Vagococcus fluvialis TaxID=2738 RepID=UPI003B595D49
MKTNDIQANDIIIIDLLKKHGPLTSSELVSQLIEINKKADLSRQWLRRATQRRSILKIDNISLPHNQAIYFLPEQQKILNSKIDESIEKYDKISQRLIAALTDNSFLFLEEALKIVAAPLFRNIGVNYTEDRRIYIDVIDYLEEQKIIKVVNEGNSENCYIQFHPNYIKQAINNGALSDRKQQLNISKDILKDSISVLEKMSIVGWNSSYVTDVADITKNDNHFNNYFFNAIGYSYSYDNYYYDKNNIKKGMPVLMDIIIHREVKMYDVISFHIRINNVKNKFKKDKKRRIVPILFVISIDKDAFEFCKRKGFLIINLTELFGNSNTKTIKSILSITTTENTKSFEEYFKLIQNDGRFNNVRGLLFNYMMAQMIANMVVEKVEIGKKFRNSNKESCECDILIPNSNCIVIFETKGYAKKTLVKLGENKETKDSVKRFFERTRKIVQEEKYMQNVVTIFITTSDFEEEAKEYMDRQKKQKNLLRDHHSVLSTLLDNKLYINRKTLLKICSSSKNKDIKEILNEYFN